MWHLPDTPHACPAAPPLSPLAPLPACSPRLAHPSRGGGAYRLSLRRVHEHVPLRAPLGEATVHGRLLLVRVRRPVERHENALAEVIRGVDLVGARLGVRADFVRGRG